jgi:UDP-3-O-[3-hydroxymyristoyl] glucosamine N-acyltransferase
MTNTTLGELASRFQLNLIGDASTVISGVGTLQHAQKNQITFLENPSYKKYLSGTLASAVIISEENQSAAKIPVLITRNPYLIYAKISQLFDTRVLPETGIHPTALIGTNCEIHPTARIGAYCVIGDHCKIGADTLLWPHVTVYEGTTLGERVIIHSGVILGSDGFGNAREGAKWVKVPQLGNLLIGNDVEIGANTTIDRGSLENTVIEDGVRLDNQIQIAHNVHIGAHTAIAACVGIAGSTKIGKNCLIGGAVGIGGHLTICDGAIITAMSGVSKSITQPGIYSSATIIQKNLAWRKMTVRLRHLDQLFERVEALEKVLELEQAQEIEKI